MTSTTIGGRVMRPYDPTYDPLVQATPGQGTGYAPTYWVASAGSPRACCMARTARCRAAS